MFLRTTVRKNKNMPDAKYLQLVENTRVDGKVQQKLLLSLGRLDDLRASGQLDRLHEQLAAFTGRAALSPDSLSADWSREFGLPYLYAGIWKQLSLDRILDRIGASRRIRFDFSEAVFCMVLNRLLDPCSKLSVTSWKQRVHHPAFEGIELQHLYRALDLLIHDMDGIEEQLFAAVRKQLGIPVDLVLFDTTSTYFESPADDVRQYGHSKDSRPDRPQVIVGVLMTREGIPIAHYVFDGNTADVDAFKEALQDFKTRFGFERVIMVADRGMTGSKVYKLLDSLGYPYILGVRMRKLKAMTDVLARVGEYRTARKNLKVAEVQHEDQRYLVCLNEEEVIREKKVRSDVLERLERKLQDGSLSLVGSSAYRKYLRLEGTLQLDESKVQDEERYDGIYILRTNTALGMEEAALAYRDLWRIERGFRKLKSGLDLRPVYHRKTERICGHVAVCFLALVLESYVGYRFRQKHGVDCAELQRSTLGAVGRIHAIRLEGDGAEYYLRTEPPQESLAAFDTLGMKPPPKRFMPGPARKQV